MTIHCPTCGHEMTAPRVPLEALESAPLQPQKRQIVEALRRCYPREASAEFLIDALFGDDVDGGPDNARLLLHVQLSRLRRILPKYGWTITMNKGGVGIQGRYRLEPLP